MSQNLKKAVLLIDYENVQNFNLAVLQQQSIDIKIFVGKSQSKIPIDLVQSTQQFGQRIEWVKIEGTGNNALDFHIAFYLGKLGSSPEDISFLILSKDKGFDPLIQHINKGKIKCCRIENLSALSREQTKTKSTLNAQDSDPILKVISVLSKTAAPSRPKTRKSLNQHVKSILQKKLSDQAIDALVESLFKQKKISEVNDRLTYNF